MSSASNAAPRPTARSPPCSARSTPTRWSKSSPPPTSPLPASTRRPSWRAIRICAASPSARRAGRCPIRRRPSRRSAVAALRSGAGDRRAHRRSARGIFLPLGGRVGWGVGRSALTSTATYARPHPCPSPQGGGEENRGRESWTSASSVSAIWAPTWRGGWSRPGTRSSSTTPGRRRSAISPRWAASPRARRRKSPTWPRP